MTNEQNALNNLFEICHANLKNSKECIAYLKEERLLSDQTIDTFKFGYFPQNINILKQYIPEEILLKNSILDNPSFSDFAYRYYLTLPLYSEYDEPTAIIGRNLLPEIQRKELGISKYRNSSYKKSSNFFGLNYSRSSILKKQNVYVVEGAFDFISMFSNEIRNTVAICGTAFSKTHFVKLAKYTNRITFLLDNDESGKKAMESISSKYMNKGIKIRFLSLPKEHKDIDSYFKAGNTKDTFVKDLQSYIPNW